jgi:hypothetical protein
VLDRAAAEKLSLTAALERVLALEVEAIRNRRICGWPTRARPNDRPRQIRCCTRAYAMYSPGAVGVSQRGEVIASPSERAIAVPRAALGPDAVEVGWRHG